MNRRNFIKLCSAGSIMITARKAHSAKKNKPNIIFFLVDDYDKIDTSVYGSNVLTPNLDRMAKNGITFHNAFMSSTVCTPSRYTCLTGRYAGSSYSKKFLGEFPPGKQSAPAFNVELEEDNMNVGAVLAQNGYSTGYIGKYHVGPELKSEEEYKAHGLHNVPKNVPYTEELNKKFYENEKSYRKMIKQRGFTWAKNIYWGNLKAPFNKHNPEWNIEAALEFIEKNKAQPFYLHYCSTLMHGGKGGWTKSFDYPEITGEGKVKRKINVMPDRKTLLERVKKAGISEENLNAAAGYLWMDDSLGAVLDKLEKLGIAENTIVLFIADHGSNMKGSLYKARGTEVPCLMTWPAGMKKGVQCHELIQNADFVPTWFDVAEAKVPDKYQIDGVSIAPLFQNPNKPVREYVYCEMGASRSIKTKEWSYLALRFSKDQIKEMNSRDRAFSKVVNSLSGGISRGRANPNCANYDQLYNLKNDPQSQKNLAMNPEYKNQLVKMKEQLTIVLKKFPNRPYGEFIPGENTMPIDSFDDILERIKKEPYGKEAKKIKQAENKKREAAKNKKDNKKPASGKDKKAARQKRKAERK